VRCQTKALYRVQKRNFVIEIIDEKPIFLVGTLAFLSTQKLMAAGLLEQDLDREHLVDGYAKTATGRSTD
jgi:hypothetical protein